MPTNKPDNNMEQEQLWREEAERLVRPWMFEHNKDFEHCIKMYIAGRKASVSLSAQEQINSINEYFDTRENVKKFLRQHAKENCKDLYLKLCIDFNAKCKELKDLQLSISLDKKEIASKALESFWNRFDDQIDEWVLPFQDFEKWQTDYLSSLDNPPIK